MNDSDRFNVPMKQVVGMRLTYDDLTGKTLDRETVSPESETQWSLF